MITKITCELKLPSEIKTHNIGSLLHGVLMELLKPETATNLHHYRYNPLKQRLCFEPTTTKWEIIALEANLGFELTEIFKKLVQINIKHHNAFVELSKTKIKKIDLNQLINHHMTQSAPKHLIKLKITSPMSFKDQGSYAIFPEVKKMLRSIMLTFDYFSNDTKLYDYEALDYLSQSVKIIDYNLRSVKFDLEKVKIPAFKGSLVLKLNANLQTTQLLNLILAYGSYSGMGIKTSIGMGAYETNIKIEPEAT